MAEQETGPGLEECWSALRNDLVFLPPLGKMTVQKQACRHEAVEFVRVAPVDQQVMLPQAPHVPETPVEAYSAWSDDERDQQRMWALVGTMVEGNRMTRTCPDCDGAKEVTCGTCHGRRRVDCTWCHGSGSRPCGSCGGAGHRTVTRTVTQSDGSTRTEHDHQTCMSCGGSGRNRCHSCMGTGEVTCGTCDGRGVVTCETCSPAGTVDVFIRRSFLESTVSTHILPVELPGYPEPVKLSPGHVHIEPRTANTPGDAEVDRAQLTERGIAEPNSRIFFVRPAVTTIEIVNDGTFGELAATFIDGKPEPILTMHRSTVDPKWTPDRERYKALAATVLWGLTAVVPAVMLFSGWGPVALLGAVALGLAAYLVYRNPIRAARLAFLDVTCPTHKRTTTVRCQGCGKDLCHECLMPSVRCPHCGQAASGAVTHLMEDGKWVKVEITTHD